MNKRIKELMNQAMEDSFMDGLGGPRMELNPEKLAELIVHDCVKIAELKEQGYNEYDSDVSVGWYIKEYFGIK